jgi:hypothetical protein
MPTLHRALFAAVVVVSASLPAAAQDENQFKAFFEGKSIVVKLDMPATQQGVDIFPDARQLIDLKQYSQRVKSFGIAIKKGESVLITRVHVKDKLIEFQLAGGGYGTFGDDTGSVYVAPVPKSQREKDLEKWVKTEDDPYRRARLQRELDDLRTARERQDAANKATAATAAEAKKARIANDRLHSGSRFNIRYNEGVPVGMGPDGLMRALSDYVDFTFAGDQHEAGPPQTSARPAPGAAAPAGPQEGVPAPAGLQKGVPAPAGLQKGVPAPAGLQKGMTMADVERLLGKPDKTSTKTEGSLKIVTATFTRGDQVISADFIEGVLVKYSISSR